MDARFTVVYNFINDPEGKESNVTMPSKDNRELTPAEKVTYRREVNQQKCAELRGLIDLECFERLARSKAVNLVDARWVITWKRKPEGPRP